MYKKGFTSELLRPEFAILNPENTFTLPQYQTACGSTDIMAHIMERYFTTVKNVELTDRLCEAALKTVINNTPEALNYLEKAVKLLPYDYQSRNNLGIVYGRTDQPEKALKELETAIWLKPEEDTIKINLSVFYLRQKEYQKAEEVIKYLINKSPNNSANLHFRLAMVYKEAGGYESAISELNKSSGLAPHIINPHEEMGNIYSSRLKDPGKAIYYYSKGIEAATKTKSKAEELRWMVQDLER